MTSEEKPASLFSPARVWIFLVFFVLTRLEGENARAFSLGLQERMERPNESGEEASRQDVSATKEDPRPFATPRLSSFSSNPPPLSPCKTYR